MKKKSIVRSSSGNIFADLGIRDPQRQFATANAAIAVRKTIEAKNLSLMQVASRTGLLQADVSKLMEGRFDDVSLGQLLNCARQLGSDVEIKIKPGEPLTTRKHQC
jgi:predicted XRE-type DNA-binding protein